MTGRALAEQVAEHLFRNGSGELAERLTLVQDSTGANLGGWCQRAVADVVERYLDDAERAGCAGCYSAGRAEGFEAGAASRQEDDALLAEAVGCACFELAIGAQAAPAGSVHFSGQIRLTPKPSTVIVHDERCPCARAAAIRERA